MTRVAFLPMLLAGLTTATLAGCGGATPGNSPGTSGVAATPTDGPYKPAATFQEVMDSVVDFSADYIWNAVSTVSDAKGVHEYRPRTDAEWHEFRRRAVLLVEAANLLSVPGRRVANSDKTAETGDPLPVADIQKRLDAQHDQLVGFANGLRDVSLQLVAAADRKDVDAITELGGTLDEVCEACHVVFWYPEQAATYPGATAAASAAAGSAKSAAK